MCAPTGAILMNTFGDKLLTKDADAVEPEKKGEVELPLFKHGQPSEVNRYSDISGTPRRDKTVSEIEVDEVFNELRDENKPREFE